MTYHETSTFIRNFLASLSLTMGFQLNPKPLPCVAHLRRQSHKVLTNKTKTADLNGALGRSKYAHLFLKTSRNISNALSHTYPTKPSDKKHHNDAPTAVRYQKDISCALKNPTLSDEDLIEMCSNESELDRQTHPA